MTFITSDLTALYRHALHAWVSPLATCALPKGVCYLLTYLLKLVALCAPMSSVVGDCGAGGWCGVHPPAPRRKCTATGATGAVL